MAGLLGAEHVAGPADLEVAHGDLEPRAEIGELADRLEPLVGLLGEGLLTRVEQVRVGALAPAADATAQLVQLREPEQIGAVDDERVDGRDVEAALDDRGADQHVVLAFPEVEHHPLEATLVHLPVRDADARLGDELAQLLAHVVDVLHAVVDEEHLALAQQLPPDRLRCGALVELAHIGEDGLTVLGRRVHEGEIANAGERHLERARDRCRGEREHVHVGAELLDELLVLHAEALLLVDHQEAEILEADVARQQPVGRDHHVDRSVGDAGDHGSLLLGGQDGVDPRAPVQHIGAEPHSAHGLHAAADADVDGVGGDEAGDQMVGLLGRTALAVHGRGRHLEGITGGEPRVARDVGPLLPRLGDTAADDLLDLTRLDSGPLHHLDLGRRQQLGGVQPRQPAVALADRGAGSLDDHRFSHVASLLRN